MNRIIKKGSNMLRVPFGVLLAFILSTFLIIPAKAETVKDLEKYLGYTDEEIEESLKEYENIEPEKENTDGYTYEIEDNSYEIEQLKEKSDKGLVEVKTKFSKQFLANDVIKLYTEYKNNQADYISLANDNKSVETGKLVNGYKKVTIDSIDFDIGSVGTHMKSVVSNLNIATPYGYSIEEVYEINEDGEETENFEGIQTLGNMHTGLDLAAQENSDVMAQWNGKVIAIEAEGIKDLKGNDLYRIDVYHGNGIYTSYSHLKEVIIKSGSMVGQYQKIGTVGDSMNCSCAHSYTGQSLFRQQNHMHYEVKVEKKNINPLLLYQDNGKAAYFKWYKSSYINYALPKGEKMFIDPVKESIEPDYSGYNFGEDEYEGGYDPEGNNNLTLDSESNSSEENSTDSEKNDMNTNGDLELDSDLESESESGEFIEE